MVIKRDKYLDELTSQIDKDMIKVITGVRRKYITVETGINKSGEENPVRIFWNDGRVFTIKRILYRCKPVDNEYDGMRFTVQIDNNQRDIYRDDDGQWYVEARRRFCG